MSSFIATTRHPKTGKWGSAEWLDDYFGSHIYGVRFEGEVDAFDTREYDIPYESADGKVVENTYDSNGNKSVVVNVKTIDVEETDEATLKAKEAIEKKVIPKLANKIVTAVVVHKPTNKSTSTKIKLTRVREWAKFVVDEWIKTNPHELDSDFVIVEVDHDTGDARVTTLEKYDI